MGRKKTGPLPFKKNCELLKTPSSLTLSSRRGLGARGSGLEGGGQAGRPVALSCFRGREELCAEDFPLPVGGPKMRPTTTAAEGAGAGAGGAGGVRRASASTPTIGTPGRPWLTRRAGTRGAATSRGVEAAAIKVPSPRAVSVAEEKESSGNASEEVDICAVCLETPDKRGHIPCGHTFCFSCIHKWSKTENTCPCCKVRFTAIEEEQADEVAEAAGGGKGKRKRGGGQAGRRKQRGKKTVQVRRRDQSASTGFVGGAGHMPWMGMVHPLALLQQMLVAHGARGVRDEFFPSNDHEDMFEELDLEQFMSDDDSEDDFGPLHFENRPGFLLAHAFRNHAMRMAATAAMPPSPLAPFMRRSSPTGPGSSAVNPLSLVDSDDEDGGTELQPSSRRGRRVSISSSDTLEETVTGARAHARGHEDRPHTDSIDGQAHSRMNVPFPDESQSRSRRRQSTLEPLEERPSASRRRREPFAGRSRSWVSRRQQSSRHPVEVVDISSPEMRPRAPPSTQTRSRSHHR
jgi:hypothetical protein